MTVESLTYFILLLLSLIPTSYLWYKNKAFFLRHKGVFIVLLVIAPVIGFFWDYYAIRDGVWFFTNIVNIWVEGIPIEEWAFFWVYTFNVTTTVMFFIRRDKK